MSGRNTCDFCPNQCDVLEQTVQGKKFYLCMDCRDVIVDAAIKAIIKRGVNKAAVIAQLRKENRR